VEDEEFFGINEVVNVFPVEPCHRVDAVMVFRVDGAGGVEVLLHGVWRVAGMGEL
jgi:hypothetical protein